ncbi:hypothetical protein ACFL4Q_01945 [candidate division KSB1 bacterium]
MAVMTCLIAEHCNVNLQRFDVQGFQVQVEGVEPGSKAVFPVFLRVLTGRLISTHRHKDSVFLLMIDNNL